jgi:hypothetical protein
VPRFRPMGLGDIFDEAFDLYRRHFLFLLLVCAVVTVPTQFLGPLLAGAFPDMPSLAHLLLSGIGSFLPGQTLNGFGPALSGPAAFAPVYPLLWAIMYVALAAAVSVCYLDQPHTLWTVYRIPLRRLFSLIIVQILFGLFLLLGMLLCYVGIVIPWVLLIFFPQTFALEDQNYGKALSRSKQLVSGDGGRVFGCLMLLSLVSLVVSYGVRLPLIYAFDVAMNITPTTHFLTTDSSTVSAVSALAQQQQVIERVCDGLSNLLLAPFMLCVLTVLYYDLRIRKEAFDITQLASDLHYPPLSALRDYLPPVMPLPPVKVSTRTRKAKRT